MLDGGTFTVSERCHRLAYIAYGKLLADGTAQEVVAASGLSTWIVDGPDLWNLRVRLQNLPGVEQAVAFGTLLHVSGRDGHRLLASLAPFMEDSRYHWKPGPPGLEDVFISLTGQGQAENPQAHA